MVLFSNIKHQRWVFLRWFSNIKHQRVMLGQWCCQRGAVNVLWVVVLLVVNGQEAQDSHVVDLDQSSFEGAINVPLTLVQFHAPWCGHCKELETVFKEAAETLHSTNPEVQLSAVDASVEREIADRYHIEVLPALKLFSNGKPTEYVGARTVSDIGEFVHRKAGPPAREVSSIVDAALFVEGSDAALLGFFGGVEEHRGHAKALVAAALGMNDPGLRIGYTFHSEVAATYGVTPPALVMFKKTEERIVAMSAQSPAQWDAAEIDKFTAVHARPLVAEYGPSTASRIFGSAEDTHLGNRAVMLLFVDPAAESTPAMRAAMAAVATKHRGAAVHAVVPAYSDNTKVFRHFELVQKDGAVSVLPAAVFSVSSYPGKGGKPGAGNRRVLRMFKPPAAAAGAAPAALDEAALHAFAAEFHAGAITSTLRSDPAPAAPAPPRAEPAEPADGIEGAAASAGADSNSDADAGPGAGVETGAAGASAEEATAEGAGEGKGAGEGAGEGEGEGAGAGEGEPPLRKAKAYRGNWAGAGTVRSVVGATFETEVMGAVDTDVLLMVHAPWCGHCKKLQPVFAALAKRFQLVHWYTHTRHSSSIRSRTQGNARGPPCPALPCLAWPALRVACTVPPMRLAAAPWSCPAGALSKAMHHATPHHAADPFRDASAPHAQVPSLKFASLDGTANEFEHPGLTVVGFPTVALFRAHAKRSPVEFSGRRDLESFDSFLAENVQSEFVHPNTGRQYGESTRDEL